VRGTVFEAGKLYLVYADDRNGQWHRACAPRRAFAIVRAMRAASACCSVRAARSF
jgi:hypothetical protein